MNFRIPKPRLTLLFLALAAVAYADDPISVANLSSTFDAKRSLLKLDCSLHFVPPWHVYSDTLEQEYLIATRIVLEDSAQGSAVKREFPPVNVLEIFGEKMDVFDRPFAFKEFYYLDPKAVFPVSFKLQYQACSDKICLPPQFHSFKVAKTGANQTTILK